jgi:hypothetical protein
MVAPASPLKTQAFRPGAKGSDAKPSAPLSDPPYTGASPTHMTSAGSPRIKNDLKSGGTKTHYK